MRPENSSLSIGYLSPGWPLELYANGIVAYIADMAEQLAMMGLRVTILAHSTAAGKAEAGVYDVQQVESKRSTARYLIDSLGYRIAPRLTDERVFCRNLSSTLRRAIVERDIELFEMEETFGLSPFVQRAVSIPVCVRLHGPWFLNGPAEGVPQDGAFRRRVRAEGRSIAEAVALTSSSRDVLEQTRSYYGLGLKDAEVIHPPTSPVPLADRWRLEGCDPRQVLFIGRFDRHKGGDLMIEAFGRVLQHVPEAKLCFVGPDRGYTDKEARQWTIEEFVEHQIPGALESGRVTLLGHQPFSALASLRRGAMVTVICSRYENAPRALIEAMALGCPAVAARVGGIPEIMEDQVDGLQHRPEDVDDLAAQIVTLLSNRARAVDLGRRAAETCERRFYPEAIAARMLDFYRWAIRRSKSPRRRTHQSIVYK